MRKTVLLMLLMVGAAEAVRACSIPVFRYALERWNPSQYELVVFSRGELDDEDQKWLDELETPALNLVVKQVDVSKRLKDEAAALWKEQGEVTLPYATIRFADSDVGSPVVWSGALKKEAISRQIESPLRRRIGELIIKGHSAVWVLVESGDKAADDKLAAEVEGALRELEGKIELPEIDPFGPQLRSALPLKVSFAMVRLSRSDAAESSLLTQLKQVDSRFAESQEALVIPVIGRGRAVAVLPASKFSPAVLENFARFVCGECSCEIKEQNPGLDLLMTANWESIFGPGAAKIVEEKPSGIVAGASVAIPTGVVEKNEPVVERNERPARRWMMIGVVVAGLAALASVAAAVRGKRGQA